MKTPIIHFEKLYVIVLFFTLATLPCDSAYGETGRDIVKTMVSAHGGIEKWRSAPTVSFEDRFIAPGTDESQRSQVTVEQGSRRAYIDFPGTNSRMAWDGKQAWSENWKSPFPPRFLALLNYYFSNLPWLTMDRGVQLGEHGKLKLRNDPTEYITVKMTFDPGVGDTPDDYYVLYIDPETHRLKACEYVATYAAILPPGTKASPPNILIYESYETVDGLVVPTRYSIYKKVDHTPIGTFEMRNWSFKKPFDSARMTKPAGAVIDESKPR